MQSLSVNPGAHGTSLAVSFGGARAHLAQVSSLGRGSPGVPLRSLLLSASLEGGSFWLAGDKGNDRVALEGSFPVGRGGGRKGEEDDVDGEEEEEEVGVEGGEEEEPLERKRRGNWVLRILRIASLWAEKARRSNGDDKEVKDEQAGSGQGDCCCCDEQGSEVCRVGDGEEAAAELDRESFSKMLRRVALADARKYAKMSYLGNLAYTIPKINVLE